MIRLQIVERPGADLYRNLLRAMRSGDLRTFLVARGGKRITHRNPNYPGWVKCSYAAGVMSCEVRSPRMPGTEWRLLSALVGRLADKYPDQVHSISIQFAEPPPPKRRRRRRK